MIDVLQKLAGLPVPMKWVRLQTAAVALALSVGLTATACSSSETTATAPSSTKCAITLATSPTALERTGGTGTVMVTTTAECAWTASSEANWIAGVAPASGQGTGQVEFRVPANPAATARLGDIVVNTSRIQVRQDAGACGFELATGSQTFSEAAGTGTVTLNAAADGCAWTAASNVSWIAIASGESGAGSASVSFRVQANGGAERSGSLTIAGQTFTVRQGGVAGSCAFTLSPLAQAIGAAGGGGTPVAVSAAAGCAWTAAANVPWITVSPSASGTGNGTIAFSVAANTGTARSGSVTITGGQQFTVNQAAAAAPTCSYTVSPDSRSIGAAGGPGTPVAVSTGQGCAWSASAGVSWITVTGGSGSGNGTIAFSVAANTGAARSGSVTVTGGQQFTVNQAAAPAPTCSYTVSPDSRSIGAAGGPGAPVAVSTGQGCAWSASAGVSWITISGGSGSGNGTIAFSVAANTGPARSGTVTVTGGQGFTVNQAAAPAPICSYAINPTNQAMDASGGNGTVSVSTAAGCVWVAVSNDDWIRVTSGATGSGNGTVGFSVTPNDDKGAKKRDGTITIAGRPFAVSQSKK